MNSFDRTWRQLTDLARRAPVEDEFPAAPPGFATRVAARWLASRGAESESSIWEWLAIRGLAVACVLTILAALSSWPSMQSDGADALAHLADPLTSEVLGP